MYLQQTLIHQFMISVFYRDDFENSGEKNKRGSVDLYMFTGRGFEFFVQRQRSLTLSRLPQFPGLIGDPETSHHNQPIFATPSSDSLLFKVLFLEEPSKVLFLGSPIHSYQCVPWNQRRMKSRSPVWRKKLK
jgi:hypothetical protein